jgi:hypothetical protein
MGVLGIIVQTEFGLPLYIDMFNQNKLAKFQQMDTSLTSGFITAMTSFAREYDLELGHVKFRQQNVTDDFDYGINMISMKKGVFLILCFVEPFVYHEVVKEKIEWIYERILKGYEEQVVNKLVSDLHDEEKVFIADILQDLYIRAMIAENKESIDSLLGQLFMKYVGIYGISINSFDNSLLYTSGIAEDTFKLFLNNMGRRSSIIGEYEVIDSYISIPDYQAMRVYAMNPGLNFEIRNIMTNLPEKTVTLYYYVVADPNLNINPVVSELIKLLKPFFSSAF